MTGLAGIAQRVARGRFLECRHRDDVAGEGLLDVLAVVGMHLEHAADPLFPVLGGVEQRRAGVERARVDAAESDRTDERVVHDLEGQHRQWRVVGLRALDFRVVFRIDALHGRHVERRRQVVDDGVEQRLHALVLERRAAQHGIECAGQHGLADEALDGRNVRLLALEEGGHDVVIEFGDGFDQLGAIFGGLLFQVVRDRDDLVFRAELLVVPDDAAHFDEVDDALEGVLDADRELQRDRLDAEALDEVVHAIEEVRADLVHLVGEDDARNVILVGLPPDGLGLRLDALVAVEHGDGAVENAQASARLRS